MSDKTRTFVVGFFIPIVVGAAVYGFSWLAFFHTGFTFSVLFLAGCVACGLTLSKDL